MAKPRIKGASVGRGVEFVDQLNNTDADFQIPGTVKATAVATGGRKKTGRPKLTVPSKKIMLTLRPEMYTVFENLRELFEETPSQVFVRALACLANSEEVQQRKLIKSLTNY